MIKGLYETHINVIDLERSMKFYENVLGFQLGHNDENRRIAFYFIGGWNHTMLGLWEKPEEEILPQHLAFEIEDADMEKAIAGLNAKGVETLNFFMQESNEPIVFGWMPATGIYFRDPDGHLLEYIARLPGDPMPDRAVMTRADWEEENAKRG